MRERITAELALLRQFYPQVEHVGLEAVDWFLVPEYRVPAGWRAGAEQVLSSKVCFPINAGYPAAAPYSFLLPANTNFEGVTPNNTTPSSQSPFAGAWLQFSWAPEAWFPHADLAKGSNLLVWVRSFVERLKEGA